MGKWILFADTALVPVGAIQQYALDWFGKLPGSICIESERRTVYIPPTLVILVSWPYRCC